MNQHTKPNKIVLTSQHPIPLHHGTDLNCDVLIIGAGLAGISVALSLPTSLKIIVLAKEDLTTCSSHYAQGGIAACIDDTDSVAAHVTDTLVAGDGLCDKVATTEILTQGGDAIEWLSAMGVAFTTEQSNPTISNTANVTNTTQTTQTTHPTM